MEDTFSNQVRDKVGIARRQDAPRLDGTNAGIVHLSKYQAELASAINAINEEIIRLKAELAEEEEAQRGTIERLAEVEQLFKALERVPA